MSQQSFQLFIPAEEALQYSPEMLQNYALNLVADEFERLGLMPKGSTQSSFDFDTDIRPTEDYGAMQVTVTFEAPSKNDPFNEPCYFGEDGEWMAIRGDITPEEAARRCTEFDDRLTGEKRIAFDPALAIQGEAYVHSVDEDGEDWRLELTGEPIRDGFRSAKLWVFDNY